MKSRAKLLVFFLIVFFFSIANVAFGYDEGRWEGRGGDEEDGQGRGRGGERGNIFVLPKSKQVMRSEAGEIRVVKSFKLKGVENPMHIGFINMEPKSMLIPQYLDSTLIFFIRKGKAKIGSIYKDALVETNLKVGDVYRIAAGSAFYIVNTGEGQILQMICSIDTTESLGMGVFQSFSIGGGIYPKSILGGFDERTLTAAFNVSSGVLWDMLSRQKGGPMVFINGTHDKWASFAKLKHQARLHDIEDEDNNGEQQQNSWVWRKLMNFVAGNSENAKKKTTKSSESTAPYNLYDRSPDFENEYGSSRALTKDDYPPLGHPGEGGIGVYLVSLKAGAMLAPHLNPTAMEIGIVTKGSGSIQVGYPNGSSATNAVVNEGDVFLIPRYFPFCQIASREEAFEFFGFTTSASENRPQFLVGGSSVLQTLKGPELAAAFGMSEDEFNKLISAQKKSIILPSTPRPEHEEQEKRELKTGGSVIELWE